MLLSLLALHSGTFAELAPKCTLLLLPQVLTSLLLPLYLLLFLLRLLLLSPLAGS
jgi:hypothetical protein